MTRVTGKAAQAGASGMGSSRDGGPRTDPEAAAVFAGPGEFVGHFVEGKPPESLRDWRFLFVGLRWRLAKVRGRA